MVLGAAILLIWLLPISWNDIVWSGDQATLPILLGVALAIVVLVVDYALAKIVPYRYLDDGGINQRIFEDRNVLHIALLAFMISFSEELLFRGVLQYQFGIVVSTLLFIVIHFRYLKQWILLLSIAFISLSLALLVHFTSMLLPAIIAHFLIDFVLGVLIRYDLMPKK